VGSADSNPPRGTDRGRAPQRSVGRPGPGQPDSGRVGIARIARGGLAAKLSCGCSRQLTHLGRASRAGRTRRDITFLGSTTGSAAGRNRAHLGFARRGLAARVGARSIVECPWGARSGPGRGSARSVVGCAGAGPVVGPASR